MQGYIAAEEVMSIPELSINPLARRLERMFETVNFKAGLCSLLLVAALKNSLTCAPEQDFVGLLAAFSKRASREMKLHLIFTVYDMDGDGVVSAEDLSFMLRQLAGRSLRCCCWLLLEGCLLHGSGGDLSLCPQGRALYWEGVCVCVHAEAWPCAARSTSLRWCSRL